MPGPPDPAKAAAYAKARTEAAVKGLQAVWAKAKAKARTVWSGKGRGRTQAIEQATEAIAEGMLQEARHDTRTAYGPQWGDPRTYTSHNSSGAASSSGRSPAADAASAGGGAGVATRRSEAGTRTFYKVGWHHMHRAKKSWGAWAFETSKVLITALRTDQFNELIPHGLMDDQGFVAIRDLIQAPSIAAWNLTEEDVRDRVRHQGEKKRF